VNNNLKEIADGLHGKNIKLILHQYNKYNIYQNDKFLHILTGYAYGLLSKSSFKDVQVNPMSNRKYMAAFIGQLKQDKQQMIDTFNAKSDNTILNFHTGKPTWSAIDKLQISPKESLKYIQMQNLFQLEGVLLH